MEIKKITKITFIVPTFNRADVVTQTACVNSKLCERYGAKLVVIDNNSEDNSYQRLLDLSLNMELVKNNKNIGLKGSFERGLREYCLEDGIIIFLSDEDIIYEPGLKRITDLCKNGKIEDVGNIIIFNHIDKYGRDYIDRRYPANLSKWSQQDVFSCGLISGFGYRYTSAELEKLDWHAVHDKRNNYPHWSFMHDGSSSIKVIGIVISTMYFEANLSFLDSEWHSGTGHYTNKSVKDYLAFHSEKYKTWDALLFRYKYKILFMIFRNREKKFISLGLFVLLMVVNFKEAISIAIRKLR